MGGNPGPMSATWRPCLEGQPSLTERPFANLPRYDATGPPRSDRVAPAPTSQPTYRRAAVRGRHPDLPAVARHRLERLTIRRRPSPPPHPPTGSDHHRVIRPVCPRDPRRRTAVPHVSIDGPAAHVRRLRAGARVGPVERRRRCGVRFRLVHRPALRAHENPRTTGEHVPRLHHVADEVPGQPPVSYTHLRAHETR